MTSDDYSNFKNPEDEDDSLETIQKSLYSRQADFSSPNRNEARFRKHNLDVPKNWGDGTPQINSPMYNGPQGMSFMRKLFFASLIFFLVSAAVAGYVFFGGGNVISANNVDITVTGPVSVAGGEVLPLEIKVTNKNNADLEVADLIIDYPDGTRQADDTNVSLKHYRESLGMIVKGGSVSKKIQAVLFGQEGDVKNLNVSVEYRVKGSNAIFPKEKIYAVSISSAPVTMNIAAVKEINSGQDVEFTVDVISNASTVIRNLAVSTEYPFGFTFKSSDPKPSLSNNYWRLGDLKTGVKRTIKVRGTIVGQDSDERTFKFSAGTESATDDSKIGTSFLTVSQKVAIRKPFIGASLALDGDLAATHITKSGKNLRADLVLTNNAGLKITDLKVSVKISGNIFNPAAVSLSQGFYRSSDNTILWDQTLNRDLMLINPDESLTLSFSLGTLSDEAVRLLRSPEMQLLATITGKRQNESGLSQEVTSTVSKNVRVSSSLGVSTRSLYFSGPFTNTGPIPPKVDSDTSYTIVWSLTNGSNDLSNVKMTATLPSYVKWLNISSPSTEKIAYNEVGGQIIWDVGDLKAGTGFSGSPRQISFQVSITPSGSQIKTTPVLVTGAVASGDDSFTKQTIEVSSQNSLTTELTTDLSFRAGQGMVAE
jgi:hypothetical protein